MKSTSFRSRPTPIKSRHHAAPRSGTRGSSRHRWNGARHKYRHMPGNTLNRHTHGKELLMPKHTRSAGGIVVNNKGNVLVVNQNRDSWSLPKGHIKTDEEPLSAAIREIQEESGVTDLQHIKYLGSYDRFKIARGGGEDTSELKTIMMHLFFSRQMHLEPVDPHNPEARWVKKEEVAGMLTHAKDKEFYYSVQKEIEAAS
ncbi:MAG: NUDIX domain-containing protein [Chitinivibrionales bacterium]|nr:NUDIX domain-containing protein [Chitinivibrionales bacterium]